MARLGAFVRGSYPLPLSPVFAAAWATGATGLFAAADPRVQHWRPGWGTLVAVLTVVVDLLLLRIADDLRDLPYDRRHHPTRPLASGAVTPRDLTVLATVGALAVLALNAGDRPAQLLLAAQLAYTAALVGSELGLGWPRGDAVVTGVLLSSPVQVLLNLYLYARFLADTGLSPDRHALAVLAAVTLAATHHELARKLVRAPGPHERSYVRVFGLSATTAATCGFAVANGAVALAALSPWEGGARAWGWSALLPLLLVAAAGRTFVRTAAPRWPAYATVGYLPAVFLCYLLIGVAVTS
ncbi:hypothetical protein [Kitasatospora sp. NPDC093806]|uniref:hypothetical protein n=1 Tax=Kitasatospora sp. NPDC093806 TaxID=3155075 RepID=UPI003432B9C0